jgi:nucleotide-binding universal stress UspA family protein
MKKIIVPCDFSNEAVNAFRMAVDIAAMSKGEVHLVNVVELPVMHDTMLMPVLSFEESLLAEVREKAEKQFLKLQSKYAGEMKKIKSSVLFGATAVMLLRYIEENGIDLVLMGSKGSSGVREALIGSNAEKIVRRAEVPVVVVKKYLKASDIKNIILPNTLEHDQEAFISKVKALQNFFKAKLHIVYINTPTNFTRDAVTRDRLEKFAKRYMFKDYTLNVYNDVYEENGVINFSASIGAGMVAMGTHGRKGISHVLSGSIAEDVVNHIQFPIWTYTLKS